MACVGIFDSGLGGLTIWAALKQQAPDLPCLYFADQAHLPYGPRSGEQIRAFSEAISQRLIDEGARLIVVACNTASAAALEHLRARFPATPFVGMEPAVKPAALHTRSGVVGLMATRGTLKGALLRRTAARFAETTHIVSSECPGLAEAIEAGLPEDQLREALGRHVAPMQAAGADTVVLGCSHYPLVMPLLRDMLGPAVHLIDPAPAVARQALRLWQAQPIPPQRQGAPDRFASSSASQRLQDMLRRHFDLDAAVEHWHWRSDAGPEVLA